MFTAADFNAMTVPGLEGRMAAIKATVRPKLQELGRLLAPELSALTGRPVYPRVAMHARRKVNPPDDTWIAWSASPRGYKMVPHYQVGIWSTHLFIQAGVIYEAGAKAAFGAALLQDRHRLQAAVPPHFRWLEDYTQPHGILHRDMTDADFLRIANRLQTRREADCMVGLEVPRDEVVQMPPETFLHLLVSTCRQLLPIWELAVAADPHGGA